MKEKLEKEFKQFRTIYKGADNQLVTLTLTDIMALLLNITKDEEGNIIRDYSQFDTLVNDIKQILEGVTEKPRINIADSLKTNLEQVEKMKKECEYSLRTLSWVLADVIKEENDEWNTFKKEENDA